MEMISRSLQSVSPDVSVYFSGGSSRRRSGAGESDDEEALRWAALERLPSFERLRTGILRSEAQAGRMRFAHEEVDVRMLEGPQRQAFVESVFRVAEEDNERFLKKLRARIDRYVRQHVQCDVSRHARERVQCTGWSPCMRLRDCCSCRVLVLAARAS